MNHETLEKGIEIKKAIDNIKKEMNDLDIMRREFDQKKNTQNNKKDFAFSFGMFSSSVDITIDVTANAIKIIEYLYNQNSVILESLQFDLEAL